MASKRTPETLRRIIECLEKGMSINRACARAGCSAEMLRLWRKDNPDVQDEVEKAQSQFLENMHTTIIQDGRPQDQLALAKAIYPDEYGDKRTVTHEIVLEMPGLLGGGTKAAEARLIDVDWKAMDEKAAKGELTDVDCELLGLPTDDPDDG